jgi:hypothetical protein
VPSEAAPRGCPLRRSSSDALDGGDGRLSGPRMVTAELLNAPCEVRSRGSEVDIADFCDALGASAR